MTSIGSRVRTLIELLAEDGTVIPIGSNGTVIGHEGEKLVIAVEDRATGETRNVIAEVWECLRLPEVPA